KVVIVHRTIKIAMAELTQFFLVALMLCSRQLCKLLPTLRSSSRADLARVRIMAAFTRPGLRFLPIRHLRRASFIVLPLPLTTSHRHSRAIFRFHRNLHPGTLVMRARKRPRYTLVAARTTHRDSAP